MRKKSKKKLKTLKYEVIPEHKDYKLDYGLINTTREYRGLLKEVKFKPITLQANDTITMTFTLNYEEPPEEKNKIKMLSSFFLYEHLLKIKKEKTKLLNDLRYRISKIIWENGGE